MTHTYAIMEVTPATFEEIKKKLLEAGYQHAIDKDDGVVTLDMNGIGLQAHAREYGCGKGGGGYLGKSKNNINPPPTTPRPRGTPGAQGSERKCVGCGEPCGRALACSEVCLNASQAP